MIKQYLGNFAAKHFNQIRTGNPKVLIIKIIKSPTILVKLFEFIISIFLFILLKILRFFVLIRFGIYRCDKLGVSVCVELYLAEKKKEKRFTIDFFIKKKKICNKYLFNIQKKNINLLPNFIFETFYNFLVLVGENDHICENSNEDRDTMHVMENSKPVLQINKKDNQKGVKFLRSLGIKANSKIVLVYVRDSAYYNHKPSSDFRNSDIKNFITTINYLTSKGFYVFRMGAKVNKSLNLKNDKFFDYATNGMRSEFLDVFLAMNCYFCISTGSGFDALPMIARKPVLLVSFAPVGFLWSFSSKTMHIFKHHYDIQRKKKLSIKEIFQLGLGQSLNTQDYLIKGVKLIENSPTEIKNATHDMLLHLKNKKKISNNILHKKFFSVIDKDAVSTENKKIHNKFNCMISNSFLKKNKYLLDL